MRNTIIKLTLAVMALSTLAACGPSEKEKQAQLEAEGKAKRAAYQQRMRDADAARLAKDNERFGSK